MSTFVLVHGAWHGGWCWKRVRQKLQASGHDVFTPTLTGLGERAHLLSQHVDLETHIADVVNLICWEELTEVVLCGHSYGGCVISGVADRIPDCIRALVYLDAFVLDNGQSLHSSIPAELEQMQLDATRQAGDGWKVPPIPAEAFNVNANDRAWVNSQCTMQPLATLRQALALTGGIDQVANISFIRASDWSPSPFSPFFEIAKARGWKTLEMACGHDVMLDLPDELAHQLVVASG